MNPEERHRTIVHIQDEPTYFVAGVTMKFITTPEDSQSDLAVIEGGFLPQTFVPLHKHHDPEIFYILDGEIEIYADIHANSGWRTACRGDVVNIPGDVKHALRNLTAVPVNMVAVSGSHLYRFFREIVEPYDPSRLLTQPRDEQMLMLMHAAARHGYWMASPDENAAIGLILSSGGA